MTKIIKRLFTVLILVATMSLFFNSAPLKTNILAQGEDDREFKAVWLSSFIGELPYENEQQYKNAVTEILDVLEHYGLNALIFHIRTHNNAFYPSEINPTAIWFQKANFANFDPLAWTIKETHKRGIEFHAWLNPYRINEDFIVGDYPENNPASNPANIITSGGAKILNPALPVVREHIYDTITEIVENYDVDAIHFDDYFYISGVSNIHPVGADNKRAEIDLLIEGISNLLKAFNEENNKAVQLGISPTGIWRNGNGTVSYGPEGKPISTGSQTNGYAHYGDPLYADTIKWASEGWIDYLIPQTYWARNRSVASYTHLASWWSKMFKHLDVNLYLGIGVYMADEPAVTDGWKTDVYEFHHQLSEIEEISDIKGYSIFSYKHIKGAYDKSGLRSSTQVDLAYYPAGRSDYKVPPIIKNMKPINLPRVNNLVLDNEGELTWDSIDGAKFYYIYKSESLTYDSSEIIGVVGHEDGVLSFATEDDTNEYEYGVRALSKTNHFGEPSQTLQLVKMKKEVSLRTQTRRRPQGLKFNANLDESVKNNEHGFYLIYGPATTKDLKIALNENSEELIINNKKIFKVTIPGVDKNLDFSVVLTGIPQSGHLDAITVISYVVDNNGKLLLSLTPITTTLSDVIIFGDK